MPDQPYRDEDPTRQIRRPGPLRSPLTGRATVPGLQGGAAGSAPARSPQARPAPRPAARPPSPPEATRVMPRPEQQRPQQRPPQRAAGVRPGSTPAGDRWEPYVGEDDTSYSPVPPRGRGAGGSSGAGGASRGGRGAPPAGPPRAPRGRPAGRGPRPARRRRRGRRLLLVVLLVVALVVAYPVSLGLVAWQNVRSVGQVGTSAGTPGTTFLLVGSDSRAEVEGGDGQVLTDTTGSRTDTILLLHTPRLGGPTVLVSLPRDSYVEIPGRGLNKLNAAYAFGGPALLTDTVEGATGLGVDGYVETGFGGFASVVDALDGVDVCLPAPLEDSFADIDLPAGCQTLEGQDALGLVRTRKTDARGDLARVERQREVLGAIMDKTVSPAVLLDPRRSYPTAAAGGSALAVDDGMSPFGLGRFVLAMRSAAGADGVQLTVPVSNPSLRTPAGSAVEWDDARADELWAALRADDTRQVARLVEQWESELSG